MKAATLDRYGPPEVLRVADMPKPVPGNGEVLVRVRAATVTAGDVRLRLASPFFIRFFLGLRRPRFKIPGMTFAGTIEDAGANVSGYRKGDDLFGSTGLKFAANAEYACAPSSLIAAKPANATFGEAAAIAFGGVSALHFLRKANVQAGQRVLIYGASGSVGTAMVQIAKRHFGAHVTGVCSTANLALVRSIGADEVVDYTKDDFSKSGAIYDVVVEAVGKARTGQLLRSLKRGGACVFVASTLRGYAAAKVWAALSGRAKIVGGVARGKPGDLDFLKGLVDAGKFKPVIDRTFPLEEIVSAHRYAESGRVKGNVVIAVS